MENENENEPKQEQKQEQKQDEPKQEQEQKQDENLTRIVTEIKEQYENKIEALKDAYGKQIAERDIVIKQLLSDNNTAVETETMVDKINKKRNYKKW